MKVVFPVKWTITPGYLGKSSFTSTITISDATTGETLMEDVMLAAMVNVDKMKPEPISKEFRESYGHLYKDRQMTFESNVKPVDLNSSHKYSRQIMHSDLDENDHINQPYYSKFCIDAASLADRNGLLKGFKKGLHSNCVFTIECVHKRDAHEGDVIDIFIWEKPNSHHVIFCQIEHIEEILCLVTLQYHPFDISSNL